VREPAPPLQSLDRPLRELPDEYGLRDEPVLRSRRLEVSHRFVTSVRICLLA
jgi:hypothetical protein